MDNAVKVSKAGTADLPIIKVKGELDAHGARALEKVVRDIMSRNASRAIIDLKDCTYIDSAGLGVLFSLVSWARQRQGSVAAVGPPVRVLHVLRLMRLTDERGFQVFTDLDSAEASFAGG
jgi:anti-anti-sigma factor